MDVTYDAGALSSSKSEVELREVLSVEEKKRFLAPRMNQGTRFLDVGCGMGGYLIAARELGCARVVGVEPSAAHSRVASEAFGLDVKTGFFSAQLFDSESFDLILLSHVIEHIYDPGVFVDDLLRVLAPGGHLVIVTPNASSTLAILTGRYWVMLKPPDHVTMLTAEGLRRLPALGRHSTRFFTDEYSHEIGSSMLASARDALLDVIKRAPSSSSAHDGANRVLEVGTKAQKRHRRAWLEPILSVASAPIHLFNIMADRRACLIAEVEKR